MKRGRTKKIALCGTFAALCLAMMLSGCIIPFATFCAPAIAGVLLLPISIECGVLWALLTYAAVSLLCLILVPDLEMTAIFVGLLGYYPLLKPLLDRIRAKGLRILAKLGVFSTALGAVYGTLLLVFSVPALRQELYGMGAWACLVLAVLSMVTLFIYDRAIFVVQRLYCARLHPRLRRFF